MKALDGCFRAVSGLLQGALAGTGLGFVVGVAADPASNPNNWVGLSWLAVTACGTLAGMAVGLSVGLAWALSPDPARNV